MEGKTINKNVTKLILNELSQNVFDPYNKTFVNDVSTAGQKLATGVAEGSIYEPTKTELNIAGENVIKKSKDFTKLPSKTQTGLLHVAGIDLSSPEGRLKFRQISTAKVLNKILEKNKIKVCNDQLSEGKGVVCGATFAERDPNAFMEAIKRNKDATKIINKPGLVKGALKGVSAWAKKN